MRCFLRILPLLILLTGTACKKEDDEPVVPATEKPKNTSILVVNGISDNTAALDFKLENESLASVAALQYSKYVKVAEGSRTLNVTVDGARKEFPVAIAKDKVYTAYVYGTKADVKVALQEDTLTAITDQTKFSFRYTNLYNSVKNISVQYYYPQYSLWATTANTHENIPAGKSSKAIEYTAGVEVEWRIIEAGTEQSQQTVGGIVYKVGSSNVLYTSLSKMNGATRKHYTFVVFGSGSNVSVAAIQHEAQLP